MLGGFQAIHSCWIKEPEILLKREGAKDRQDSGETMAPQTWILLLTSVEYRSGYIESGKFKRSMRSDKQTIQNTAIDAVRFIESSTVVKKRDVGDLGSKTSANVEEGTRQHIVAKNHVDFLRLYSAFSVSSRASTTTCMLPSARQKR